MLFPDTKHPWDSKPLGELFRLATVGVNPNNHPREEFHHYSIPAWDELGGPTLDLGKDIDSGKFLLTEGCILVSKLNPQISRVRQFSPPQDGRRACASTEIMAYVPRSEDSNLAFFTHYMRAERFRHNLIAAATGTTNSHRRVRPPQTLGWVIPVPPPEEQAAIARILDAVDTAIERTNETVEKARVLDHSLLHALLDHGLSGKQKQTSKRPAHWHNRRVDEVAEVGSGVTLGKDVSGFKYVELPYLRVANVQDGHLDLTTIKTVKVRLDEVERYRLEVGDVLMTEGGDIDKLGRGTLWDGQIPNCLHQNHIFRVRANRAVLDPRFFAFVVESDIAKSYFLRVAKRTTNLASTNKTQVRAFRFPVPPVPEQERIAEIVTAAKTKLQSLMQKQEAFQRLKTSLMHDLLTGKVRVNHLNLDGIPNP